MVPKWKKAKKAPFGSELAAMLHSARERLVLYRRILHDEPRKRFPTGGIVEPSTEPMAFDHCSRWPDMGEP